MPQSTSIASIAFRGPDEQQGLEVVDLRELLGTRHGPAQFGVHRARFHTVLIVQQGEGVHDVDFGRVRYAPGTVLWVRPGTVQRFHPAAASRGRAVLFTSEAVAPDPMLTAAVRPSSRVGLWRPGPDRLPLLLALVQAMERLSSAAGRAHVLSALLHELLDDQAIGPVSAAQEVYQAFEGLVEERFRTRLTLRRAAADLGWSARTVSRAVQRSDGRTPKAFIDARVLLEAQRCLAFTDDSVARIAHDLGFGDMSAFGTFFGRLAGLSPAAWRDSLQ